MAGYRTRNSWSGPWLTFCFICGRGIDCDTNECPACGDPDYWKLSRHDDEEET